MLSSSKLIYLLLEILHGIDNIYAFRFIGGLSRDHRNPRNIPGLNLDPRNLKKIGGLNRNIGGLNRNSRNLCMNRIINGCPLLPGIATQITYQSDIQFPKMDMKPLVTIQNAEEH